MENNRNKINNEKKLNNEEREKIYLATKICLSLHSWLFVFHSIVELPPLPLLSCRTM